MRSLTGEDRRPKADKTQRCSVSSLGSVKEVMSDTCHVSALTRRLGDNSVCWNQNYGKRHSKRIFIDSKIEKVMGKLPKQLRWEETRKLKKSFADYSNALRSSVAFNTRIELYPIGNQYWHQYHHQEYRASVCGWGLGNGMLWKFPDESPDQLTCASLGQSIGCELWGQEKANAGELNWEQMRQCLNLMFSNFFIA